MYPNGFRPMEGLKEDDYQYNIGTKFNVLGWDMDVDVGYGKDIDNIYTWNIWQPLAVHRHPHLADQFL